MDSVLLVGSEAVERAGSSMRAAAAEMQQAALNLEGALQRHERFMDDWLERLRLTFEGQPHDSTS